MSETRKRNNPLYRAAGPQAHPANPEFRLPSIDEVAFQDAEP
ncbi:hypothetical protein [Ancylobacter polymorphus]|uniref:Uncharacterized protein n=1 Tax=Ancylobacter polymorphus TaxID=223390 RepID=A0ABU0BEE6_9HYPH|nr:hypothetical protein [Ancylobacter polymorphus]MDQ0304217.1 hypothetical protein [Ancylobacter polymorphus]